MKIVRWGLLAVALLAGCKQGGPGGLAHGEAKDPSFCGMSLDDWCPSVAGDPCGAKKDTALCKLDERCEALPYRGESAVACRTDERCFADNCPAVGCISRCEVLSQKDCERDEPCLWKGQAGGGCAKGEHRCRWDGARCVRSQTCVAGRPQPRTGPPPPRPSDDAAMARANAELAGMGAARASDVVKRAPARALVAGRPVPSAKGRAAKVPVMLAPGPPGELRVPTTLSAMEFWVLTEDDGGLSVSMRPWPNDLYTTVALAIASEEHAIEYANVALQRAGVVLPPGRKSWRESLVSAALDAGVERDQKVRAPRWMLAFDPCDPSCKTVELDGSGTTVVSVNGGPAPKMP